ncbi:MAG: hypothetical protein ACK5QC_04305 [Bacteroidota bacterium]|jgi:hypothetical protein
MLKIPPNTTVQVEEKEASLTQIVDSSKIFMTLKFADKTKILIDSSDADIITLNELHSFFQKFLIQNNLL